MAEVIMQRVERKVCEGWRCGAMFYRVIPVHASLGEKLCPACRERELRWAKMEERRSREVRGLRKAS